MRSFANFVAIDWSGAKGQRHKGIAIAIASGAAPPEIVRPGHRWSRGEALAWLAKLAEDNFDALIGFDFSPAFPFNDLGSYFPQWEDSPADMIALWKLVEACCANDAHLAASGFVNHPEGRRHFRHAKGDVGDQFAGGLGRLRKVESWQRETRQAASASVFNLIGANQVGKASLTGMRVLHRVHPHIPLWPLDNIPLSGPLLVEIYTTVSARAASLRAGISKIRDGAELDKAIKAIGSKPVGLVGQLSDHVTDALLTAAWLRAVAGDAALWSPPLLDDTLARTEGWTFGII